MLIAQMRQMYTPCAGENGALRKNQQRIPPLLIDIQYALFPSVVIARLVRAILAYHFSILLHITTELPCLIGTDCPREAGNDRSRRLRFFTIQVALL